ncbi:MAG: hypothetical protein ACI9WC_000819 [Arenicella sp.]|jgi:hypothetical protein
MRRITSRDVNESYNGAAAVMNYLDRNAGIDLALKAKSYPTAEILAG